MTRNKFNAKRKEIDGHKFPSLKEASYYLQFKDMLAKGEISDLQLQPQYELLPSFRDNKGKLERAITYKPDFLLTYPDGRLVVVEVKGFKTKDYIMRRKLFKHKYSMIEFWEV